MKISCGAPTCCTRAPYLWNFLWDYESELWEHALDATICSLRRKLGPKWGANQRPTAARATSKRSRPNARRLNRPRRHQRGENTSMASDGRV